MTTLKSLKKKIEQFHLDLDALVHSTFGKSKDELKEATSHSMACDKCGNKNTHLSFREEKNKSGNVKKKTYRVCDDCGSEKNITGLPKTKHGVIY